MPPIRADSPIELGDADALDPHFDRQREARRRRNVVGRRLRLERQALRAQSAHDDAAGKERERIPRERDVVRRRVRVAAAPLDAPDAHRVEQRTRGAVDLERAAAPRDELADDEIDAGLGSRGRGTAAPMIAARRMTAATSARGSRRRRRCAEARCGAGVGVRRQP